MSKFFVPFTERGERIEKRAIALKSQFGLGPYEVVDPFDVLPEVPAKLVSREFFGTLPRQTRDVLLNTHSHEWSAIGLGSSPDEEAERILLNPTHHPRRQKVSLMEEIVHIMRDHPRVVLERNGDDRWTRSYDETVEQEAFAVGAACIIPYKPLFRAVNDRGESTAVIADRYGVSEEYVEYRIKLSGLYNVHRASS